MKHLRTNVLGSLACLSIYALVGCGGGGDDGGTHVTTPARVNIPDSSITSVFGATLSGSVQQDFIVVVHDGQLYGVYGTGASKDFNVAGLITSWGNSASGSGSYNYAAMDGIDWESNQYVTVNLVMNSSMPSIVGTITSRSGARAVSGGAIPSSGYNFNTPATLDAIRGHWDLTTTLGVALAIDISADGVITGTLGKCTLHNSGIKPSISGKNVFALVLDAESGRFECNEFAGDGVRGFALAFPSAGGGTQLVMGGENGWDPVSLAAAGKR